MHERARAATKTMGTSRCDIVFRHYTREEVTVLTAAGLMKETYKPIDREALAAKAAASAAASGAAAGDATDEMEI